MTDGTNKEHLELLLNEAEGRLTTMRIFMKDHMQALENVVDELRSEISGPKQIELSAEPIFTNKIEFPRSGLSIHTSADNIPNEGPNGKA